MRVKQFATRLLQSKLAQNAAALYGIQVVRKLLPLIIIPYLARTLGPSGWGMVAFMQSLAEFLVLVIEFGFNLSGTREIARNRDSITACRDIVSGVVGAQCLLAFAGVLGAFVVTRFIPLLSGNPKLVGAGLLYAVIQGFMPLWFFQGVERMKAAATLETCGRIAGLIAIFALVRSPNDAWIALAIQALSPGVATIVGLIMVHRQIPFRMPTAQLVVDALRRGWPLFIFRSAESLYGIGNAFLLGLFATPAHVGYFASAEKISRAFFGLLNPIRESLYPRLSHLARHSPDAAARLARKGVVIMVSGGVALGAALFVGAPWIVGWLMGPEFGPAVTVLRILSALPVLLSVTHSVGLQWLLPMGRDAEVNRVILSAGALNIALAVALAPVFSHVGMAVAVVGAEAFVCVRLVRCVWRTRNKLEPGAVASLQVS
jgi:PST family polysaccharide transporter